MIKIDNKDGIAQIFTPYNQDFIRKIKMIGGSRWSAVDKCWEVPESSIEVVRDFMMEIYGYSDISKNETVKLKLTFIKNMYGERSSITLFGKVVASAYGRDSNVKIGEDVTFVKESPISGGSVKNWYTLIPEGAVVILDNVNKNVFEKSKDSYKEVEVQAMECSINKQALLEEKAQLLKRIEEIDQLLNTCSQA